MKEKYNAFYFSIFWTLIVVFGGLVVGLIADYSHSGGEQIFFAYVAYSIFISLVGIIIINIIALFFYSKHSRKRQFGSLILIVLPFIILFPIFKNLVGKGYDVIEKTRYIGKDKIEIRIEYYPDNDTSRIIRSQSFWKNGKKDSIWSVFSKEGDIISRKKYKNGKLVK